MAHRKKSAAPHKTAEEVFHDKKVIVLAKLREMAKADGTVHQPRGPLHRKLQETDPEESMEGTEKVLFALATNKLVTLESDSRGGHTWKKVIVDLKASLPPFSSKESSEPAVTAKVVAASTEGAQADHDLFWRIWQDRRMKACDAGIEKATKDQKEAAGKLSVHTARLIRACTNTRENKTPEEIVRLGKEVEVAALTNQKLVLELAQLHTQRDQLIKVIGTEILNKEKK